jgi:hypothetical protein
VTHLSLRSMGICNIAGNELAYTRAQRPPVVKYLRLPSGGIPIDSWEDDQLGLEYGINSFSAHPEKNLLVVLEAWFDDDRWVACPGKSCVAGFPDPWGILPHRVLRARLHVRRLAPARDIVVPHNGQLR